MYTFLSWVDTNKLDMSIISRNPKAIWFLHNNIDKIDWTAILSNPAGLDIISMYCQNINWNLFLGNESDNAYDMILPHIHEITEWKYLCQNRNTWINKLFSQYPDILTKLSKQDIYLLCGNTSAMPTIEKMNLQDINWQSLSMNENALDFLNRHPERIVYLSLQANPNIAAYDLFTRYYTNVRSICIYVSQYSAMVPFLKENPEYIDSSICMNENPDAYDLILNYVESNLTNMSQPDWDNLSDNPIAVGIMRKNIANINWRYFCRLETDEAIQLMSEEMDKLDWSTLSKNPAAIQLLSSHVHLVDWSCLSYNNQIYEKIYTEIS